MGRALIAAGSVPVLERPEEDAPLVTELIAGEHLVVLGRRDGWLRVVAPGHATGLDPRGYPGWARPGGLVEAPGWDPDLAVVAPNGAGLPLGALLRREGEGVRLPDGGVAALEPGAVKPAGVPVQESRGRRTQPQPPEWRRRCGRSGPGLPSHPNRWGSPSASYWASGSSRR